MAVVQAFNKEKWVDIKEFDSITEAHVFYKKATKPMMVRLILGGVVAATRINDMNKYTKWRKKICHTAI